MMDLEYSLPKLHGILRGLIDAAQFADISPMNPSHFRELPVSERD